ncbi:MAG: indolepyruvate oxidoreductase subunit beta [Anaerolineae bacterium]
MKYDMILAGVGGQGVLSIAATIAMAAVSEGLRIKQAEVHGMSQRGGAVQSHLRLSDRPIFSDLIPDGQADMVLAMEPMEALRYVPLLAAEGVIVTDSAPVINIPDYPDPAAVLAAVRAFPQSHVVDASAIAKELHNPRGSNMVLLGAASVFLPLNSAALERAIEQLFARKGGAVVEKNIEAFRAGRGVIQLA